MNKIEIMGLVILLFLLIDLWFKINPKLDFNTETGDKLLWYNDITDSMKRKFTTLWRIK